MVTDVHEAVNAYARGRNCEFGLTPIAEPIAYRWQNKEKTVSKMLKLGNNSIVDVVSQHHLYKAHFGLGKSE